MFKELSVKSHSRSVFIDITADINALLKGVKQANCTIFIPHTTAGITINENADPAVREDIINFLNKKVPQNSGYSHSEGNSDAHIKASLMGFSVTIPVIEGRLQLGAWQGVYFCEFDGPRTRKVWVSVTEGAKT